jgi:transcriptional regulator with XRE-family HTH domain
VRAVRKARGWSAEKLASEVAALGIPWTRTVVAKLETRRRPGVSVAELFALAYVLRVAPIDLLVPAELGDAEPYVVADDVTTTARKARGWIAGVDFLAEPESRVELNRALEWMPRDRAEYIAEHWQVPPHVMEREAKRVREQNAAMRKGYDSGWYWQPTVKVEHPVDKALNDWSEREETDAEDH